MLGNKGWKENKWTISLCSGACSPSEHDSTTPYQLFITSQPWAQFVEVEEEEELNCQLKYVQLFGTVFCNFSCLYCEMGIWDLEVRQHPYTLLLTSIIKHGNNLLYLAVQTLAIKTETKDPLQVNFVAFPAKSWLLCNGHIRWTVKYRVGKEGSYWGLIIPGLDLCVKALGQGSWQVQNKDLRWGETMEMRLTGEMKNGHFVRKIWNLRKKS